MTDLQSNPITKPHTSQAEAFRASLSAQLLHLLQEAEDRVQQRMREAARTHLLPGQHRSSLSSSSSCSKTETEATAVGVRVVVTGAGDV